jgi:acyl-coenzyme A synthetase/AMP-(fatty) acid ligase
VSPKLHRGATAGHATRSPTAEVAENGLVTIPAGRDGRRPQGRSGESFPESTNYPHEIPRHIKFVEGFPTTVTGKVQKFAMREAMIAELDLVLEKTA